MPLKVGSTLPPLSGATQWLNISGPAGVPSVAVGRPILIHFWAKSCPACKVNMPTVRGLAERYSDSGLQVFAIHMPRGPFDLDVEAVLPVVRALGITEPCAIDNEHTVGNLFDVSAWPTYYLFGANGTLKRHAAGGLGVRLMESALNDMYKVDHADEQG